MNLHECRIEVKNSVFSVATPTITEGNSATSYEIGGTSLTLTCTSTSDSAGSGTYAWNKDGTALYVILIIVCITKTNTTKMQPIYLQKWRNCYALYCTNNR